MGAPRTLVRSARVRRGRVPGNDDVVIVRRDILCHGILSRDVLPRDVLSRDILPRDILGDDMRRLNRRRSVG